MRTIRHEAERHLEFWAKHEEVPGYVYVIQGDLNSPVKIGYAKDPLKRLATLQTGNPQELRLRAVVPAAPDFEQHMHQRANRAHLRGEWFHGAYGEHMVVVLRGLADAMVEHSVATGTVPNPYEVLAETVYAEQFNRDRRDKWSKVSSLWLDGYTQPEIAEKLDLPPEDMSHIFRVMREQGGYELAKGAQRVRDDRFGGTMEPLSFRRGNNAARRR